MLCARAFVRNACASASYRHAETLQDSGLVHSDIKPDNILVAATEHALSVKLIDLGSAFSPQADESEPESPAAAAAAHARPRDLPQNLCGATPEYLAPECVLSPRAVATGPRPVAIVSFGDLFSSSS